MVPRLRKFSHEDRLKIAHHIADRVVKKYRNNVLAVYVCGSTSKKLDRPYSDLELIVVVRDRAEISMKYYLHRGLIIQIEYLKSSKILSDAEQFTDNWPWEADQYRNRIALYERDRWFKGLDEAVAKNDKKNSVVAIRKSFMMMTESMAALRNAVLTQGWSIIERAPTRRRCSQDTPSLEPKICDDNQLVLEYRPRFTK